MDDIDIWYKNFISEIQNRPNFVTINCTKDTVALYSLEAKFDLELLNDRVPVNGVLIINESAFNKQAYDIQLLAIKNKWTITIVPNKDFFVWFHQMKQSLPVQ